jgi:hypothetical protein
MSCCGRSQNRYSKIRVDSMMKYSPLARNRKSSGNRLLYVGEVAVRGCGFD